MVWVKLDDRFVDHWKVASIEPRLRPFAIELAIAGMCYCGCELTDGLIPTGQVRRLADFSLHGIDIQVIIDELVAVGLWEVTERGYAVHDFLDYNPSKADNEAMRAKKAAAGAKGAEVRWSEKPVPEPVIGYWATKTGREPSAEDMRSLSLLCSRYGSGTVNTAIGQACVQGESPENFALLTTICRAEVA